MLLVRKAKLADINDLNKLRKDSYIYHQRFDKEHFAYEPSKNFFKKLIYSKKGIVLVAESDGKIIGFVHAIINKYKIGCIADLFIKKNFRKKGFGIKLFNELIKIFRSKKVKEIESSIWHTNEASLKLHKKLGFKPTNLWMSKKLK